MTHTHHTIKALTQQINKYYFPIHPTLATPPSFRSTGGLLNKTKNLNTLYNSTEPKIGKKSLLFWRIGQTFSVCTAGKKF
jgi:hypothetical protein